MTMLKQEEMFALKESSFPRGNNFSKFWGILMRCVLVVGILIERSGLEPWPLHATETRDKCRPDWSLGSYADLTLIYLAVA